MPIDLEKIGSILKVERGIKGLTVVDISNALCIRKSLIAAIEEGNWSLLPHAVYVRGYLKEYAHLLDCYEKIAVDIACDEVKLPLEMPIQQKTESRHTQLPKRVIAYPLGLVLLVGVLILSQIYKNEPSARNALSPEAAPVSAVNSINTDGRHNGTDMYGEKKLMITCQERTWVSVVIDDVEKKEFMLNPHDIIVLNAKENYDLLVGNAAGVRLILNGNDVQFTGFSGEVKRVKLS